MTALVAVTVRVVWVFAAVGGMMLAFVCTFGALTVIEILWARHRLLPTQVFDVPVRSGVFGAEFGGEPLELALLGDSLAVGVGAQSPDQAVGVLLANGLAVAAGRPVQLRNVAVVGAESKDLAIQIRRLAHLDVHPEVVVIIVGGNDVMHLQRISSAVQYLFQAVQELRHMGCRVVVATCPDMGTVRSFGQPLRFFAHWLSRLLVTAQTIVVLRSGGRAVSFAETLGPLFRCKPKLMFSTDRVHPSAQGYEAAADVLLPSVCAAAAYWTGHALSVPHRICRHDHHVHRLAWFAFRAARHAGMDLGAATSARYASKAGTLP